jgi:serine/threonine protein phosphatase 1
MGSVAGVASVALQHYEASSGNGKISSFDEIYIGHTPVPFPAPIVSAGIWMMDTGAGWSGVLSMMDVDTKAMYISDAVPTLYPGIEGRKKRAH